MLMRLTGRFCARACKRLRIAARLKGLTVTLDLPGTHAQVIGLPLEALVVHELIAQLRAERVLDERIGGEFGHGLLQRLRKEIDTARAALGLTDSVEVIFVRFARIDALAYA